MPTLAEQLSAIRDEAPAEYDPESQGFASSGSRKKSRNTSTFGSGAAVNGDADDVDGDVLDAGRADYVDVG